MTTSGRSPRQTLCRLRARRFDAIVPDSEIPNLPYDRAPRIGLWNRVLPTQPDSVRGGAPWVGDGPSPGMVKVATRNGQSLGLDIDGRVADAEGILYDDNTFDLVVGHAVLHHIPRCRIVAARGASRSQAGRPIRVRG